MGRKVSARNRSRRKGAIPPPPEPPKAAEPPTAAEPLPAAPTPSVGAWGKMSLPPSGLASEILSRADAAAVEPVAPPPAAPVALAVPASAAVAAASPRVALAPPAEAMPSPAHNISFFAAPAREEKKAVEATEHIATFFLAPEEYGVDVRLVQEIIRLTEITQVPRAPEFIKGVINLRGRVIPVVDLKRKLGLGEVSPSRQSRIVVVKVKDRLIGLLVDGASQVLKVPVSLIEAAPEEVLEVDAAYIRGVAKLEARLIILMDLQKILAPELREAGAEGLAAP